MTIKLTTLKKYKEGIEDRKKSPLHNGLYKLKEVRRYPKGTMHDIERMAEAKKQGKSLSTIIGDDGAKTWLIHQTETLAYRAGKDLIPSIEALTGDGLPTKHLNEHLPFCRKQAEDLIKQIQAAEWRIRSFGVAHEYSLWLNNDSELLTPCLTFNDIVSEALDLYDYFIQRSNPQVIHSKLFDELF